MSAPILTPNRVTALNNLGGGWPAGFLFGDFMSGIAPTNLVYVSRPSDFPAPVAGVITLEVGKTYVVTAFVDLGTDVLKIPAGSGTVIVGISSSTSRLTTNSASPLLSNTGATTGCFVWGIALENTGGECINYDGSTTSDLCMFFVDFVNSVKVGTFTDVRLFHAHYPEMTTCADGFTFVGTFDDIRIDNVEAFDSTGTFTALEIGAGVTANTIYLTAWLVHLTAGQTGFDISDTITFPTAGGRGSLLGNVFDNNGGTALANLSKGNPRWHIKNNTGILDSRALGQLHFVGNAVQTTGNLNTYEDVAGAFLLAAMSERFDEAANGQLRYIGEDPVQVSVRASGVMQTTAGTDLVSLQIWLDPDTGVFAPIVESEFGPLEVKASGAGEAFALETIITLSKDHILKLRARNESDSSNLLVTTIAFTVME